MGRYIIFVAMLFSVLAVGCSDDSSDATDAVMSDTAAGQCLIEPTLASLQEHYFNKSCALSSSCHSGAQPKEGLSLEEGASYASLINVAAQKNSAKMLVVPNDPDNSFLVIKVEAPGSGDGRLMPDGAKSPMDADCSIKMLREWIQNGAKETE